jgi:DNA-binding transcriptional MerR regulator
MFNTYKEGVIMLRIGELAALCGTSIKALRYYNKMGIFKPEYIDPSNNYRYYREEQIEKLNMLLDLKNIGFTLNEISLVIKDHSDSKLLLNLLTEKRLQLEDTIKTVELKIENINSIATDLQNKLVEKEASSNNHEHFDVKLSRLVSLDSADSSGRHAIEEAIWL